MGQAAYNRQPTSCGAVMMKSETKQFGALNGVLYTFEEVGDKLPMHDHSEHGVHVTFILDGRFKVNGGPWEIEVSAGKFMDWQPEQFHEFIALEPNSRFLNIVKGV
jgi:quercetin dioxygenase-like cupin family protein